MENFNLECLKLNYLLKRESRQTIGRHAEKIDVLPNTYMNFKVVTKDMLLHTEVIFPAGL